MSSTEPDFEALARAFFDEVIDPLARAKRAANHPAYFPPGPDRDAETYFEAPSPVARMTPADFEFPGDGNAAGLIAELARHWSEEGEKELAAAVPRLSGIAEAIRQKNAQPSADVDIFCYTLF